jgi:hypothetical protein
LISREVGVWRYPRDLPNGRAACPSLSISNRLRCSDSAACCDCRIPLSFACFGPLQLFLAA